MAAHKPRYDLAQCAVTADAGDGVVLTRVRGSKLDSVAAAGGEKYRNGIASSVKLSERLGKVILIASAPGGGVHDKHQFFAH